MPLRLQRYSYRFAGQVLNARLSTKEEIERALTDQNINVPTLSRPVLNRVLDSSFASKGWQTQPPVFPAADDPSAEMDFLKDRVGIEVAFGHASFLGIDLLKFQVASYSGFDKIDVGVYVVTTREFQRRTASVHNQNWEGSLTFEKVVRYLPHFKSAIQVPIYVLGIDL